MEVATAYPHVAVLCRLQQEPEPLLVPVKCQIGAYLCYTSA